MAPRQHGEVSLEEHARLKILVTGASGFVGSHLLPVLATRGFEVVATSRTQVESPGVRWRLAPELGLSADWSRALEGVDEVVHLAGYSQVRRGGKNEESLCSRVNTDGTRRLAQQAAESGVRHFVFVSSCHAVAAASEELITAGTEPHPSSAYGRSKLAAEKAVWEQLEGTECAWTILRPPAVYGPGNASNFSQLAKLVASGIPLPLTSAHNRRSFLYVENLVEVVALCLGNSQAFGKVFLPSDGEDVSTPELIRAIARASASVEQGAGGREQGASIGEQRSEAGKATRNRLLATRYCPRLFPFPESLLKVMGRLPGLGALRKLTSSLYVDSEPIRRDLGWTPPFTMAEGLRRTLSRD